MLYRRRPLVDNYNRTPLLAVVGSGLLAALSVGLLLAALLLAVSLWPEASRAGRYALVGLLCLVLTFAAIVGLYTASDLTETASRVRYARERRELLLEELEERLCRDLDGDGYVGAPPSLPRVLPVHGAALSYDSAPAGEEELLRNVEELLQLAEERGSVSRSTLEAVRGREFYDWLLSTSPAAPGLLVSLGLVGGRGRRSAGRLLCSAEEASRRVREAFGEAVASVSSDRGNGRH